MSGRRARQARRVAARAPVPTSSPRWPLPPGMHIQLVTDPHAMSLIDSAAAAFIADYSSPWETELFRAKRRAQTKDLFRGESCPVPGQFAVVAVDDSKTTMYGAATLEPFFAEDLVAKDREAARSVAMFHRIVASLFVVPSERRKGVAGALLDAASYAVVRDHGRYAEGFVDDHDDSAGFYRRAGAYVGRHNVPLPPRPPVNLKTIHYPGKSGHWFSVDGWARHHAAMFCSRCGGGLDFYPEDGGMLHCSRCQAEGV